MATLLARSVPWYDGEPHPVFQRKRLAIANLELGLRWLHDRAASPEYWRKRALLERWRSDDGTFGTSAIYPKRQVEAFANALELGLRWLHDRYPAESSHPVARAWKEGYQAGGYAMTRAIRESQEYKPVPPTGILANGTIVSEGDTILADGTVIRKSR